MLTVSILVDFFELKYLKHFISISTLKSEHILIWRNCLEKCEHWFTFHKSDCFCTYYYLHSKIIHLSTSIRGVSENHQLCRMITFVIVHLFQVCGQPIILHVAFSTVILIQVSDLSADGTLFQNHRQQLRWRVWVVAVVENTGHVYITDSGHLLQ